MPEKATCKLLFGVGKIQRFCRQLIIGLSVVFFLVHFLFRLEEGQVIFSLSWVGFNTGLLFFIASLALLILLTKLYDFLEKKDTKYLYSYYFENSTQKAWSDSLFWLIALAISCSFCDYVPFGITKNVEWVFKFWKIVAIIMSIALGALYYHDMFDKYGKITKQEMIIHNENEQTLPKKSKFFTLLICSVLCLFGALCLSFLDNKYIPYILFLLFLCTFLFVVIDADISICFHRMKQELEDQNLVLNVYNSEDINISSQEQEKLVSLGLLCSNEQGKLEKTDLGNNKFKEIGRHQRKNNVGNSSELSLGEINFIIKNYRNSFVYGNIPGLFGFFVLFIVAFSLRDPNEVSGFIAGGAAMHMIFGNIVVAIGLRTPAEQES